MTLRVMIDSSDSSESCRNKSCCSSLVY